MSKLPKISILPILSKELSNSAIFERIDIFKIGCDKSQAVKEQKGTTIYFGDHCQLGGNDYSSAMASTKYHAISQGYKETWKILKKE